MSKNYKNYNNYNKYSNSNKPKDVVENTEPSVTPEAPVEVIVSSPEITVITPEVTPAPVVSADPEPEVVIGVVSNCKKLNVRIDADKTADVTCVINAGDEVEIMSEGETSDFYCVRYNDTIGFCVKDYITVKQ